MALRIVCVIISLLSGIAAFIFIIDGIFSDVREQYFIVQCQGVFYRCDRFR
jgi:hypothetical protein